MSKNSPLLLLDRKRIEQKLTRLSYEVYETNFEDRRLVICGIMNRGFHLACKLEEKLRQISHFELELCQVLLDKEAPLKKPVELQPQVHELEEKTVIICDDVLYTGRTMAYATMPFLQAGANKIQCLVLIHRNHLHFPIQPSFTGLALATTLQEHVTVDWEGGMVNLS